MQLPKPTQTMSQRRASTLPRPPHTLLITTATILGLAFAVPLIAASIPALPLGFTWSSLLGFACMF